MSLAIPEPLDLKLDHPRSTWPTFDRASLLSVASDKALLLELHSSGRWETAGLQWRSRFLLQGEVYRHLPSGRTFRSLGTRSGAGLGWLLEKTPQSKDCWTMSPNQAEWFCVSDWSEFRAVPIQALSPAGLFAKGLTEQLCGAIALWESHSERSVLEHAALTGFRGLREADLRPLAKELQVDILGLPGLQLDKQFIFSFVVCIFSFSQQSTNWHLRRTRAELLAALASKILPHLSPEALGDVLLAAVATPDNILQLSDEIAAGLLGSDAAAFAEAAAPLPPEVAAANRDLQETAARLKSGGARLDRSHYWTGPPANISWTREDQTSLKKCLVACFVAALLFWVCNAFSKQNLAGPRKVLA